LLLLLLLLFFRCQVMRLATRVSELEQMLSHAQDETAMHEKRATSMANERSSMQQQLLEQLDSFECV
jgi:hypothetical protein